MLRILSSSSLAAQKGAGTTRITGSEWYKCLFKTTKQNSEVCPEKMNEVNISMQGKRTEFPKTLGSAKICTTLPSSLSVPSLLLIFFPLPLLKAAENYQLASLACPPGILSAQLYFHVSCRLWECEVSLSRLFSLWTVKWAACLTLELIGYRVQTSGIIVCVG